MAVVMRPNHTAMNYSFEFIGEDEALLMEKEVISTLKSEDGFSFEIASCEVPHQIIVKYIDSKDLPEKVWRCISVLPTRERSMTDIEVNGIPAQLMILTGVNDKDVFFVWNDGILLVDIGFDAGAIADMEDLITSQSCEDFFNNIGEIMCLALMGGAGEFDVKER
jgi:hypothetical protein